MHQYMHLKLAFHSEEILGDTQNKNYENDYKHADPDDHC